MGRCNIFHDYPSGIFPYLFCSPLADVIVVNRPARRFLPADTDGVCLFVIVIPDIPVCCCHGCLGRTECRTRKREGMKKNEKRRKAMLALSESSSLHQKENILEELLAVG